MSALESGATLTMVRRGAVTGPGRELRRALQVVEDSRNLPTQPYEVVSGPAATTLLTPRTPQAPQYVVEQEATADGSSLRFLMIGLALGVILAFLLSGHNLVRLRTSIGMAILPPSAIQQIQQQALVANPQMQVAPQVYAAAAPAPVQQAQVAPQTQFQPVPRPTPVVSNSAFPIPEVDVNHLPRHNPAAPRQASRPRSGGGGAKAAAPPPSDDAFDARTIEASLKD